MNLQRYFTVIAVMLFSIFVTTKITAQQVCDSREILSFENCTSLENSSHEFTIEFTEITDPNFVLENGQFNELENGTGSLYGTLINVSDPDLKFRVIFTLNNRSAQVNQPITNSCLPNADVQTFYSYNLVEGRILGEGQLMGAEAVITGSNNFVQLGYGANTMDGELAFGATANFRVMMNSNPRTGPSISRIGRGQKAIPCNFGLRMSDCNPCALKGGDTDGDGICDDEDCEYENKDLPTTPGKECDDKDANTINDVIQADGCDCKGVEKGDITFDCNEEDITATATYGAEGTIVEYRIPTAETTCELNGLKVVLTEGLESGKTFPIGTTTVTYTATDGCGNEEKCSFDITVKEGDKGSIAFNCNNEDITATATYGAGGTIVEYRIPAAETTCELNGLKVVLTEGLESGKTFPIGTTTVTYTATDGCGNEEKCSFDITVKEGDKGSIAFNCNNEDITATATYGAEGTIVEYRIPTAETTCELNGLKVVLTEGLESGKTFPIGTTTVTYTATDDCGNEEKCSFDITVKEGDKGSIAFNCNNEEITTTATYGAEGTIVEYRIPTAETTCELNGLKVVLSEGLESGKTFPIGTTTVTYTAVDDCGNEEKCSFDITVNEGDSGNITFDCNDEEITATAVFGTEGTTVEYRIPTAETTCELNGLKVVLSEGLESGKTFPIGTTTVTYVATDECDNKEECTFKVTVVEGEDPCAGDKSPIVSVETKDPVCEENNGTVTFFFEDRSGRTQIEFSLDGGQTYPLNVADNSGSATFENLAAGDYDLYVRWGNDECPVDLDVVTLRIATKTPGTACNDGDANTINDVIIANGCDCKGVEKGDITFDCNEEDITATATYGAEGTIVEYRIPTAETTCELNGLKVVLTEGLESGKTFPIGTTTVTYTATDGCGNEEKCSFDITVKEGDKGSIAFNCNNEDITATATYGAEGTIVEYRIPTAETTCELNGLKVVLTEGLESGKTFPIGTTTVTYTATDGCGNEEKCSFDITVKEGDKGSIAFNCNNEDITATATYGAEGTIVEYRIPTAETTCELNGLKVVLTEGLESGKTFPIGTTTVTYTATDDCGNEEKCSFDITVKEGDKGNITFDCNDEEITATAVFGTEGTTVEYRIPTAETTCELNGLNVVLSEGLESGKTFPIGTTTVTYVATDECDNKEECTFKVTVVEGEDPCAGDKSPIVSVETKDPVCEENNGTITFFFEDRSGRTQIEFSLDGGQTYPLNVADNSGSATFENLAAGDYDLYVRWGNDECPVDLDVVTLRIATKTPGTACNDGDANTINDVIIANGCDCKGVEKGDITFDCNEEDITATATYGAEGTIVEYRIPTAETTCELNGLDVVLTEGLESGKTFPIGTTTVTYTATDDCGNEEKCSFDITVNEGDSGNITFDCNDEEITATAVFGTEGTTVEYRIPTAETTCELNGLNVVLSEGLESGKTFPIGTTTVTYVATDECDNKEECTFKVTVVEGEDPCAGDKSPIVSVETKDPVCEENNGTVTFFFEGRSDRTHIEFSLDGGQTFPLYVTDESESASFENLAAGDYDLYVRWGNDECPVDLDVVTLSIATKTPGSTCDDGDEETINDVIQEDGCSCVGEIKEDDPIVVDPNACTSRTAFNTTLCQGSYEGTLYGGYMLFKDLGRHYNLVDGKFVEYKDGTANLTGVWINIEDPEIIFEVDVKLAGRTVSTPPNSPKSHGCLETDESEYYYYLQTAGTIIGKGKVEGAKLSVGRAGPAFQFGVGANPTNSELSFGAAGWITLTIVNQPTTGMELELITSSRGSNGDININLTGDPFTCVENRDVISTTCVDDITVNADAGTNGAVVNWQTPTFSSNCIYNANVDCSEAPSSISGFEYLGELDGSKYFASTGTATYLDAKSKTIQEGGYLAVICSQEENDFITSKLTADVTWIGFSDEVSEGTFLWSNGHGCDYTNWLGSDPNDGHNTNEYTGADYTVIQHNSGGWLDRNGAAKYKYIMEIPCTGAMPTGTADMTQTEGPASGTVFPVGETTVAYEGVDGCGNTVTCSFKVKVNDGDSNQPLLENPCGTSNKAIETYIVGVKGQNSPCFDIPNPENVTKVIVELWVAGNTPPSTVEFTTAGGTSGASTANTSGIQVVQAAGSGENEFLFRNTFNGNFSKICSKYSGGRSMAVYVERAVEGTGSSIYVIDRELHSKNNTADCITLDAVIPQSGGMRDIHFDIPVHEKGDTDRPVTVKIDIKDGNNNILDTKSQTFTEQNAGNEASLFTIDFQDVSDQAVNATITICSPTNNGESFGLGLITFTSNCGAEELADADRDGRPDSEDCAPNDPNLPATPGTACDDGNANTINDVILADGCDCAGEEISDNVCTTRTASNTELCMEGTNLGTNYGGYLLLQGKNRFYTLSNGKFTEYNDGTALLTGRWTNIADDQIVFDVSVTLTGRTANTPADSPKPHHCLTTDESDFYYYLTTEGTLTGRNKVAGAKITIGRAGPAFQFGIGANPTNTALSFGAAGWITAEITQQPTTGETITLETSSVGSNGDININLSGDAIACIDGRGGNSNTFSCDSGLLANPDFESDSDNWWWASNISASSDTYFGAKAALANGGAGGVGQSITATPETIYTLSVYAKKNATEDAVIGIKFYDADNNEIKADYVVITSSNYDSYELSAKAPSNAAKVHAIGWKNEGAGKAWWDGFCFSTWTPTPADCNSNNSCALTPSYDDYIFSLGAGEFDNFMDYDNADLTFCDNGDGTISIKGSIINGRDAKWAANVVSPCGAKDGWYVDLTLSDMQDWAAFKGAYVVHDDCQEAYLGLDYWDVKGSLKGIGCNAGRTIDVTGPAEGNGGYRMQIGQGGNSHSCGFGLSTWFEANENGEKVFMDIYANVDAACYESMRPVVVDGPCAGSNAPQVTVDATNPDCGQDNGKITFNFGDHSSRTNIEFSLDGGQTYPLNVSDNVGSTSFDNLAEGKYELFVRWGNDDCPVELITVRLEGNTKAPGSSCNDGNGDTENDVIQSDGCTCSGEAVNDGECDDLLVNPSFEQYGLSPWKFNSNTSYNKSTRYRADGDYMVWIYKKYSYQKDAEIYQDAVAIPGAKYSFTFYSGTHNPGYNHEVAIEFYNSYGAQLARKAIQIDFDVDGGDYLQEYFLEDTAPTGTTKIRFVGTAAGDYLKLDAICVQVDKSNAQVSGRAGPSVSGGTQEIGEELFYELDEITLGSSVKKEGIQLDWYSKNSSLPSKYVIEKSVDGKGYIRIQEISDIVDEHLTIIDDTPDYGTNSYRVIQEFENGQAIVSNIREEKYLLDPASITLYPNPVVHDLNLRIGHFSDLEGNIRIFSSMGTQVYEKTLSKEDKHLKINVNDFKNGMYFLIIEANNRKPIERQFIVESLK